MVLPTNEIILVIRGFFAGIIKIEIYLVRPGFCRRVYVSIADKCFSKAILQPGGSCCTLWKLTQIIKCLNIASATLNWDMYGLNCFWKHPV